MDFNQEVDTSGLNCPMPVMKTKKALHGMGAGQILHLIATDPGSNDDIPILVSKQKSTIVESYEDSGKYHFFIKKN